MRKNISWWLRLAEYYATASKDPSTKVGAILVDEFDRIVSAGYNGFPVGTYDDKHVLENRKRKLLRTLHAEANAILFAKGPATTLYCTHPPCSQCMAMAIQKGIKRIYWWKQEMHPDWKESFKEGQILAQEAGVYCHAVTRDEK